jgi:hypothetical protein
MSDVDTLADDYADGIAVELRHLDTVLAGRAGVTAAWEALDIGITIPEDRWQVVHMYLTEVCLEVDVLRSVTGSGHTRVEIRRTIGGPSCYITRSSSDGDLVDVTAYFGSQTAVRRLSLPTVAHCLDNYADMYLEVLA